MNSLRSSKQKSITRAAHSLRLRAMDRYLADRLSAELESDHHSHFQNPEDVSEQEARMMSRATEQKPKTIIGVHISKGILDLFGHAGGDHRQFSNNAAGLRPLSYGWLENTAGVVFDATGPYRGAFERLLIQTGWATSPCVIPHKPHQKKQIGKSPLHNIAKLY